VRREGAASGILDSSPMGAVGCVRCKRLDGADSARASRQSSADEFWWPSGWIN
jgi:hypothetical protein